MFYFNEGVLYNKIDPFVCCINVLPYVFFIILILLKVTILCSGVSEIKLNKNVDIYFYDNLRNIHAC